MDTDDREVEIEEMLVKLKAYIENLNEMLKVSIPEEMGKSKKECSELIKLAGELDAFFTKQ